MGTGRSSGAIGKPVAAVVSVVVLIAGLVSDVVGPVSPVGAAASPTAWVHQLGALSQDEGFGVAVDSSGNSYITGSTDRTLPGSSETNAVGNDAFVAKYDTNGTKLWVHQLGTPSQDEGFGVAVDSSGNSYITGFTDGHGPLEPQRSTTRAMWQ